MLLFHVNGVDQRIIRFVIVVWYDIDRGVVVVIIHVVIDGVIVIVVAVGFILISTFVFVGTVFTIRIGIVVILV